MAPRRNSKKNDDELAESKFLTDSAGSFGFLTRGKIVLASLLAPLPLIYLNLRCEKSLCILWQLPLVIPTHTSAYFSVKACAMFLGFLAFQFCWKKGYRYLFPGLSGEDYDGQPDSAKKISPGFSSLFFLITLTVGLSAFVPEAITAMHQEHLRLLVTTWVFCVIFAALRATFIYASDMYQRSQRKTEDAKYKKIAKDKVEESDPLMKLFYYGSEKTDILANIEMKHFFYVNIGLVGWAMLDLLMILNAVQEGNATKPGIFIFATQLLYIGHTIYFEKLLFQKPYMDLETFGYNWLQKVAIYLPFLSSLVTYSAVISDFDISPAVQLCNCVFFLFGFVVHTSSIHQMQIFLKDPKMAKVMESLPGKVGGQPAKRFLISGYWSFVHKPDLIGLFIMWVSWAIAGGLNAVSLIVLAAWAYTMLKWAKDSDTYNKTNFPKGWPDYNEVVPRKLIPYVY